MSRRSPAKFSPPGHIKLMAQQNFQLSSVVCTKSNYLSIRFYDLLMCLKCVESILITVKWELENFSKWLKLWESHYWSNYKRVRSRHTQKHTHFSFPHFSLLIGEERTRVALKTTFLWFAAIAIGYGVWNTFQLLLLSRRTLVLEVHYMARLVDRFDDWRALP